MTQKDFGALLEVSSAAISDFENCKRQPPFEFVLKTAFETEFATDFFLQRIADPFREEECSFRHRRTTAQKTKDQVRAHASLIGMVVESLREIFRFPGLSLPSISAFSDEEIEAAAEACRIAWNLDIKAPIRQVGRALENAGIIIISSSVDTAKIDAFSRFGSNPMVFLNRGAGTSPARWNFDLGHELGHLVMHQNMITGSIETESAADKFSSAFLLPRAPFASEFRSKSFSWTHIFELKRRWQVSAAAIVRRARDLGLIDELVYRRAFQYMSAKRWRVVGEPYEPAFQEPELFVNAIKALKANGDPELSELCEKLGFSQQIFGRITGIQARPVNSSRLLSFPNA